MQVVVTAARKGGAGKTTLARHIGVQAERAGQGPVVFIDTDPQGGLAAWWNVRQAETPAYVETTLQSLPHTLSKLEARGVKLVVIDTPPQVTEQIARVVALADLVLVPARPSPDDLRALAATIDLVEAAGRPLAFVLTDATKKARLTAQAAVALSAHGPVAPVILHRAVVYGAAADAGLTVGELEPNSAAAAEVEQLWLWVRDRLRRVTAPPAALPAPRPQPDLWSAAK